MNEKDAWIGVARCSKAIAREAGLRQKVEVLTGIKGANSNPRGRQR